MCRGGYGTRSVPTTLLTPQDGFPKPSCGAVRRKDHTMKRAVIVQGLGFGDEGKGATVDFLARELSADLVVRYCGGSQAGHNVVLPDGRRHAFAQFGAGTLAGAGDLPRRADDHQPASHAHRGETPAELTGEDPFYRDCQSTREPSSSTVYHQQLNRLRELSRGANRHGSCGHGIGETRHYWLQARAATPSSRPI